MFKDIFKNKKKPDIIDTEYEECKNKLESIFNNEKLMVIIENMYSVYVCSNFIRLYTKFKNLSKDTAEDLLIIGRCERIFNREWKGDFFEKLQIL